MRFVAFIVVAAVFLSSLQEPADATPTSRRAQLQDTVSQLSEKVEKLMKFSLKGANWFMASNGLWYKLFYASENYTTATTECSDLGARLVSIGMRDESVREELIRKLIDPISYYVWIGLDDLDTHNYWTWTDGIPSTPSNTDWVPGEPNNHGAGGEHCAAIDYRPNRRWGFNDDDCSRSYHYICEMDI